MADNQVLGRLRFDTTLLDKQMADVTSKLNQIKSVAAEMAKASGNGHSLGQLKFDTSVITKQITDVTNKINELKKAASETIKLTGTAASATKSAGSTRSKTPAISITQQQDLGQYKAYIDQLTKAEREYINALKSGSHDAIEFWNKEIMAIDALIQKQGEKLNAINKETKAFERYQKLQNDLTAQSKQFEGALIKTMDALDTKLDNNYIKAAKDSVKEQTQAWKEYTVAIKSGNGDAMEYWKNKIDELHTSMGQLREDADIEITDPEAYKNFNKILDDAQAKELVLAANAEKAQAAIDGQGNAAKRASKEAGQMVQQMERWLATMVVMRGLKDLWNNAREYAAQYYDAMNEIRIVTMMTEEEASALGERYRAMAAEMSVSSTEIAKAAVEFWRQGLGPEEVESRLQYTTMYAKISAMDFSEAAELMTAATNALGISADRVADVWAYLGDASASGADEVGKAMQKVSAVAKTAGIQFEWLGAYIATLSEKTRQAPEVIGTALNSIVSRLQQIKQKGFNSEDIYGINDIAKALGALKEPIALMDEATGQWRDFPDILNDIATQWENLTDKEKAYIATTMGGTKQRNVMLTLLDDLSKGAENGSRAWELYTGAMEAAGTAMDKYAIWEESVEAAQGRMNAALEEFYSILDGKALISFYDGLTGIINGINKLSESSNGLNVLLGVIAAGVTVVIFAVNKLKIAATEAAAAQGLATASGSTWLGVLLGIGPAATTAAGGVSMLGIALRAVGIGVVVAGIAGVIATLVNLATATEDTTKKLKELNQEIEGKRASSSGMAKEADEIRKLAASYTGSQADIDAFNKKRAEIINKYPELKNVLGNEVKDVNELAAAYKQAAGALDALSEKQTKENWQTAHSTDTLFSARRTAQYGVNMIAARSGETTSQIRRYIDYNKLFMSTPDTSGQSIWELQNVKQYAEQYIGMMRDYIASGEHEVTDGMLAAVNGWQDYLYTTVIPRIDEMTSEARDKYIEGMKVIATDALNPYEFDDVVDKIPSMLNLLIGEIEKSFDSGQMMGEEAVRNRAQEMVETYLQTLQAAQERIPEYVADAERLKEIGVGDVILQSLAQSMRNGFMNDAEITEMLTPLIEALGKEMSSIDELIGGGESEDGSKDDEPFDKKLEKAFKYLEKIGEIRELITEMLEEGVITEDILEGVTELFGPEFLEGLIENLAEGAEELDFSTLLEAVRARLAEAEEDIPVDKDGNSILKMLGLDSDNVDKAVKDAMDKLADAADVDAMAKIWEGLPQKVKDAMGDTGKEVEQLLKDAANDSEDAADQVEKAMDRIRRSIELEGLTTNNKVWADLADILDDLTGSAENAFNAIGDIGDRLYDAGVAAGALEAAAAGDADALAYLADMTGLSSAILGNDLTAAELAVAQMGYEAAGSVEYLANWLYQVGAIDVDTSGKIVAIGNLQAAADACGMTVAALAAAIAQINGASLTYSVTPTGLKVTSKVPTIKWTGGSGSSKRSSGGGGGGGRSGGGGSGSKGSSGSGSGGGGGSSSSKTEVSELVEALVDAFDKLAEIRDHRRELAQLGQSYHEARGEIQGVIAYLQAERDIVKEDTEALETYLSQLETQIEANKAILSTSAEQSAAWKQATVDLDKLQEEHKKYSQQLIKNQTDVENLTKAIKEQYDKIRQMEIDLRDTILEAIEDREAANERMLNGRIEMEEEILDLIKKRYEKERDEIIATQEARRDALNEELDQIDELLAARKKLAEDEDKMAEVAELEAQIARISADPTRRKEAMQLQEKLNKLRSDLAWDAAEDEANAQKDSIKKQIKSIDEYIAYVEDYYAQILNNPQLLMEEMEEILTWTDDQIIAWLKKNSEDYANSTAAVQRKMVKDWQDTLDDMRDTIRTYWDEVETIIAGGADNILNFLTTHSQKYREAGKLQAEAYVDQWKQQLKDLENAYKQVTANIQSYDYAVTKKIQETESGSSGGGSSGGSSGGSGGGGYGGGTTTSTQKMKEYHRWQYANATGTWTYSTKNVVNQSAFEGAKKKAMEYWSKYGGQNAPIILAAIASATMSKPGKYLRKGESLFSYATGGMANTTGLAWLDGTKARPERILSGYQTELFEDMISTLHAIRQVHTGYSSVAPKIATGGMLPNIDTINITVESLSSDADYEDGAEKLMNAFYQKIARGRPVGGIQDR